jgi:UDP-N-acetylglucosamine transferase subunit ALG13
MIFVSLGTQGKSFLRLLEIVEKNIINGTIREPVIAQIGMTNFTSKVMKTIGLLTIEEFNHFVQTANIIICHAGYGILSSALKYQKKIIAAARRAEYGEHTNNHQLQILEEYEKKGYLLALDDFSQLGELLNKANLFTPAVYKKNNKALQLLVAQFIDNDSRKAG